MSWTLVHKRLKIGPAFCLPSVNSAFYFIARLRRRRSAKGTRVPPWLSQNVLSTLTPVTPKSSSNSRQLLHPCQMHPRCKFGDHRCCLHRYWRYKHFVRCPKTPVKYRVGQDDLVFGLRRPLTSVSLCARFQVCVQRLRFVPPFNATDRQTYCTYRPAVFVHVMYNSASQLS